MEVSVRLSELSDEEMKFIRQIEVNHVDLYPSVIPGFHAGTLNGFQTESVDLENILKVIEKIRAADLEVMSFCNFPPVRDALMGKPEGEKQLEGLSNLIKLLGEESIPLLQVCLETVRHGPGGVPGRYTKEHSGGYLMGAFSLKLMRKELAERDMNARWAHHFKEKLMHEEYFSNCVKVLERVTPIAEDFEVKLMIHFDDPPVSDFEGLLPGITNPLLINRLFEAVPSKNVGLLFCCGTRYESGVDIYEQIKLFGRKGKIFHIHFRNVRGTLPSAGEYEEVALDDGDMDMFKVLQTLKTIGYDGAINPDHTPILVGDVKGRASLAFAAGYIKALISALS